MTYRIIAAATAALFLGVSAASAVTMTAVAGDCATDAPSPETALNALPFTNCGVANRRLTGNIEYGNVGDGDFYSLGLGGSLVLEFSPDFTGPAAVIEVTNGDRSGYLETASVWGSVDGTTFALLGNITNASATATVLFSGIYKYLGFVDTSPVVAGRDGFDIDALTVTPVPLPAGAVLLLGALGGLGLARRRRKV